ncbi:hypothetical protein IRZ71_13075 [Flavobacterium sp. ANB]|uniref:hypothetical protein n=1 Tax=unclassified Flavobacterium TaxID=196869 RepID=UPI0012B701BD|nr:MULTISPECIES: hypothetical protein [unclassified Flavobacterium]MBF4517290.1 hypothetical protein [Flavobacterium sp. ANB]MTD70667.1 hypothetical protein [Flavobacterium sp. LC2016-13]
MAKVLKFKDVNSDIESRMKEFEKMRLKLKAQIDKDASKKASTGKEGKGLLKSISGFFADTPKTATQTTTKK